MNWVIDLDGVMWLGAQPIEGSPEAVAELLLRGDRVVFATNNSTESGESRAAELVSHGLPEGIEVVTSADAAAGLADAGDLALVVGGDGLVEALRRRGCRATRAFPPERMDLIEGPFTLVVVGLDREFDYRSLDLASSAVRSGARLVATNTDATFPSEHGPRPGAGSLVIAVETASGATAEVAGKPHGPMAELLRARLAGAQPGEVVVVGDRVDTDGELAKRLGWPFALVLSGVTDRAPTGSDPPVAHVSATLADLVGEWPR
jgi:HAD superfamily hydrolase (TIGR01450 family)